MGCLLLVIGFVLLTNKDGNTQVLGLIIVICGFVAGNNTRRH